MYGAGAAWSRLFLPGAGADPSRSEPEPPKKVAAPQHCRYEPVAVDEVYF